MSRLGNYSTVERQNIAVGEQGWVIFGGKGHWVALTDAESAELVQVLAPDLLRAIHAALPLVGALCGALAETCDEEAANTLGLLREITARYPLSPSSTGD